MSGQAGACRAITDEKRREAKSEEAFPSMGKWAPPRLFQDSPRLPYTRRSPGTAQKGFTITMTTIRISNTVGISFRARQ